jgi:hypothetical protein
MRSLWWCALLGSLAIPRPASSQLTVPTPPEPPRDAGLAMLGAWIEQWLPVIAATSASAIDESADFYAQTSDSVTGARLEGCTLVLDERFVSTVHGQTQERREVIQVPLAQVDTADVRPRIRRPRLLVSQPNVMLSGQLVLPLRSRTRTRFVTVTPRDAPQNATLALEHLVPSVFAEVPAARSAAVLRMAAALCASGAGAS